jgi:hypothetical protein
MKYALFYDSGSRIYGFATIGEAAEAFFNAAPDNTTGYTVTWKDGLCRVCYSTHMGSCATVATIQPYNPSKEEKPS